MQIDNTKIENARKFNAQANKNLTEAIVTLDSITIPENFQGNGSLSSAKSHLNRVRSISQTNVGWYNNRIVAINKAEQTIKGLSKNIGAKISFSIGKNNANGRKRTQAKTNQLNELIKMETNKEISKIESILGIRYSEAEQNKMLRDSVANVTDQLLNEGTINEPVSWKSIINNILVTAGGIVQEAQKGLKDGLNKAKDKMRDVANHIQDIQDMQDTKPKVELDNRKKSGNDKVENNVGKVPNKNIQVGNDDKNKKEPVEVEIPSKEIADKIEESKERMYNYLKDKYGISKQKIDEAFENVVICESEKQFKDLLAKQKNIDENSEYFKTDKLYFRPSASTETIIHEVSHLLGNLKVSKNSRGINEAMTQVIAVNMDPHEQANPTYEDISANVAYLNEIFNLIAQASKDKTNQDAYVGEISYFTKDKELLKNTLNKISGDEKFYNKLERNMNIADGKGPIRDKEKIQKANEQIESMIENLKERINKLNLAEQSEALSEKLTEKVSGEPNEALSKKLKEKTDEISLGEQDEVSLSGPNLDEQDEVSLSGPNEVLSEKLTEETDVISLGEQNEAVNEKLKEKMNERISGATKKT